MYSDEEQGDFLDEVVRTPAELEREEFERKRKGTLHGGARRDALMGHKKMSRPGFGNNKRNLRQDSRVKTNQAQKEFKLSQ